MKQYLYCPLNTHYFFFFSTDWENTQLIIGLASRENERVMNLIVKDTDKFHFCFILSFLKMSMQIDYDVNRQLGVVSIRCL